MSSRHIVVVGASAAGVAVAEQLRRLGYDGQLSLVGAETHPPYDRPPLSKRFLAGELPAERLWLKRPEDIEALALTRYHGRRALAADMAARTVSLDDGTVLDYTDLVAATGVTPRELPGTERLTGAGPLKTLEDARALAARLRPGRRVVVAGGGFLGTETAWTALALGCEVTLVTGTAHPLPALGHHVGSLVAERLRSAGANLLTGHGVQAVRETDSRETDSDGARKGTQGHEAEREGAREGEARPGEGRLTVLLDDGTALPADTVLTAIGSVPETRWLAGNGLDLTDGVRCDAGGRAAPGVYACGDVAAWYQQRRGEHLRLEHRMHAGDQARVVAANLLGDSRELDPLPFFWTDQGRHKIVVHGLITPEAEFTPLDDDPERDRFTGVYRTNGRPTAVLAWNAPKDALRLRRELLTGPALSLAADATRERGTPAAGSPAAGVPTADTSKAGAPASR